MRLLLVLLAACGASHVTATPKPGAITGLVRDAATSVSLAQVDVALGGRTTTSSTAGVYLFDGLPPGQYTLRSTYAGHAITIEHIDVSPGTASYVDIAFNRDEGATQTIDWARVRGDEIEHFTATVPRIEGTVADANTRSRVAGAVVTAVAAGSGADALQTVSDDDGRYRIDNVPAGTYAVSAYYSMGGRGQIEVRRSEIEIKAGEGVLVPLWIELGK